MTEVEVKAGQHWVARDPDRLRSTSEIRVLRIEDDGWCAIERRYLAGRTKPHFKKDRITKKGLRRLYTLQHEQETLL